MNLDKLKQNWEGLARDDPMWAIITNPDKTGKRWDATEFFQTGRAQIHEWFETIAELREIPRDMALDFGCGLGRLTQPLCDHFDQVVGVDISETMIDGARTYNAHPDNCSYLVNASSHLAIFGDRQFDFICSMITLQHMDAVLIKGYLSEFMRLLKPGGLALFTLPSKPPVLYGLASWILPTQWINDLRRWRYGKSQVMEMHWMRTSEVYRVVQSGGGTIMHVAPDLSVGRGWESYLYVVGIPR